MNRPSAGEALLQLEVIKLLLQVAWADLAVDAAEADLVIERARKLGLSERDLEQVHQYLSGERPLPPPDLALLRARHDEVLDAVRELIHADQRVSHEETTILQQIELALLAR
jgi:uncharacterized tellurite resistance protein B-like protein